MFNAVKIALVVALVVLATLCSCSVVNSLFGDAAANRYFSLRKGNYWRYASYTIDSAGGKHERQDHAEFDSVYEVREWLGRKVARVRVGLPKSYTMWGFAFTDAGGLQMFIDTCYDSPCHLFDKRTHLNGYWVDVETLNDVSSWGYPSSKGRQWQYGIRRRDKNVGDFNCTRTHHRVNLADSVVDVPAGRFMTQVRRDSIVDSCFERVDYDFGYYDERRSHHPIVPPVVFTTVITRYFTANVGLVLERYAFTYPPSIAQSLRDSSEILWTEWSEGTHTMELAKY